MTRFSAISTSCAVLLLCGSAVQCAAFNKRLREKYAKIETASARNAGSLAGEFFRPIAPAGSY